MLYLLVSTLIILRFLLRLSLWVFIIRWYVRVAVATLSQPTSSSNGNDVPSAATNASETRRVLAQSISKSLIHHFDMVHFLPLSTSPPSSSQSFHDGLFCAQYRRDACVDWFLRLRVAYNIKSSKL
jgi:hypothetical protein